MAVIHVLDKHTAELIAAGEVVERPASVVKELLENAIDAGASQITVTIESGGVKLIEISDNGSGIEAEYIPTAFIRHATSKIRTEDDLNHIHTLGFRGEALASIASVARVEVLTRTENDECASVYRIEGGEDYPLEPGARGVGTTIRVQDLFYNTPARMKFLKKDSSEGTFVADIVAHVALSHPEVSFKFVREGKLQYVTPGDGKLRSAAYAVLGREFSRDLMELDNQEGVYRVWGLITQPRSCRASRSMQYFYINGRYVRNRTMMAAMETAFKGTTMQGKFPGGILLLEMPADLVDVNVHPAKTEVRFARENDIFDLVYHAVKLALAQPGTGERRFAFEEDKKDEESNKSGIKDNATENDVKKNNFTGLSAIIPGQAEPGTLHEHTPQPQRSFRSFTPAPAAAPPSRPAPASHPDILPVPDTAEEKPTEHSWTTVASGLPIRQDATLHSPAPAPTESEPKAPAFAAALGEGAFARENDIFDLVYHAVKLALAQPGTGERRFAFEEDKKDEESNKSGIKDNATENDVKKNNFTGLSAIIPGQAEPGTLHEHTPQPQRSFRSFTPAPAAAPPSRPAPASHPDILPVPDTAEEKPTEHSWTTVASGLPIRQDATLHSPAPAPTESEPKAPAFAAALGEGALDIEPDSADLPEHQDHMAAWDPAPKEEMPAAPAPQQTSAAEDTPEQLGFDVQEGPAPLRYVGEIFKTYILAERGEEICIIDKHAAHERQLFEKLAANYGDVPAQLLLEPLVVELSAEEKTALLSNLELLESAGLEIDDFGGNSVFLRSVPADVEQGSAEDLLVELADKLSKGSRDALSEKTEWVLHSISCRAAIKAGDKTSPQELMALAEKILSGEVPPFCPHGRPCVLKLTRKELEKQFGRIV